MKKYILALCILATAQLQAQNVGIGTTAPVARLHVADSSVVFTAAGNVPVTPGNTAISGAGRRMMWYPDKAAFRAGYVTGANWDKDNTGYYSFATGYNTKAGGYLSTALGSHTTASGDQTIAMGLSTTASGNGSTAMGYQTIASGFGSTAIGNLTTASGDYATAMGYQTNASGINSLTAGYLTKADNNDAMAIGQLSTARGAGSFAAGIDTRANAYGSMSVGLFNDSADIPNSVSSALTDRIFQIGNGTADNARSNAVTVLANGNTGIGTTTPAARLHVADSAVVFSKNIVMYDPIAYPPVQGTGMRMMWFPERAAFRVGTITSANWDRDNIGFTSFASGNNTTATGLISTAMGSYTMATGLMSTAIGAGTNASGNTSTAMGNSTVASGISSAAMNLETTAMGMGSTAMGYKTIVKTFAGAVIGYYNDDMDNPSPTIPAATDRMFQIGNGEYNARSNALTILRNGNVGIGTTTPARPLSFPATTGEKIQLFAAPSGEYGIGLYSGELRIHADQAGSKVSFGTQDNAGTYTELAKAEQNGAYAFSIFGSLWVNGTTYASDERFKQNITAIQSPLQKLMQINGVEYEMKTGEFAKNNFQKGRQIGLIAQNVEKVVPEAVNEQNGYKGVDYAKLVPLLLEAIKELKFENDKQQQQIDELKEMKK